MDEDDGAEGGGDFSGIDLMPPGAAPAAPVTAPLEGLAALRAHPQFDALRAVVQQNPAMLQQVCPSMLSKQ